MERYQVATTIVDQQEHENPAPYLEPPPPQTPSDIGAEIGIQAGLAGLNVVTSLLRDYFFPGPATPIGTLVAGLINIGATVGATYGSDALNNTTTQMPTLVVPPDKNNEAGLTRCSEPHQKQLTNGLDEQENLENDRTILLSPLQQCWAAQGVSNLNPLVLDSTARMPGHARYEHSGRRRRELRRLEGPAAQLLQVGARRPDDREPVAELR